MKYSAPDQIGHRGERAIAHLRLALLGGFTTQLDGQALRGFDSDKSRALLAFLAVEANSSHSRSSLASLLWPEQGEEHARASLSQALYNLRRILGDQIKSGRRTTEGSTSDFLLVTSHDVRFNPDSDYSLDTKIFDELVSACQQHPHKRIETCARCLLQLQEATHLYDGEFLAGLSIKDAIPFEEWALVQGENYHREALEALQSLTAGYETQGELQEALINARRQVELDPLWEAGQRQLIRILALNGQARLALAQYEDFKRFLAAELDIPPEKETQALADQLCREDQAGVSYSNLPVATSPFIGRKLELVELRAYLTDPDCRLVTILGPGGCGKTRLALEAIRALKYSFRDGVFLIPLSGLDPSQSLVPVIAEALGFSFREQGNPQRQLLDYLHQKVLLLVMDSFETVLSGANWISEVMQSAPGVKFLVTSRARLNIKDEQLFYLGGMSYPDSGEIDKASGFSAVQLFEQGARRVRPDFTLQREAILGVIQICRQLEGIPLGILLASAWMELFTPSEIANEIAKSLDFLSTDWSDIPERQRSLQATFDYSWNLLNEEEHTYLTALAVFCGSFSLEAVRQVAGKSVRLLESLVDKSLVSHSIAGRYQIHDLVHQFAAQRLEQDPMHAKEVRDLHSKFFLDALEEWGRSLKSARQREALEAIDQDVENLRAAWRWAVSSQDWHGIEDGLEGMGWYADLRFRFEEGERACRIALEGVSEKFYSRLYSALTTWRAHFLRRIGQTEQARQILEDELSRLLTLNESDKPILSEQANVLYELGELFMYTNREKAKGYYKDSLTLYVDLQDLHGQALVLASLGEAMHHIGPLDQAQVLLDRGVALSRNLGDPRLLSRCMLWNGWNQLRQGNLSEAETLIRESIEINHTIGDRYAEAFWSAELGTVKGWMGLFTDGIHLLSSSIPIFKELGLKQEATLNILRKGLFETNLMDFQQASLDYQECLSNSYELSYQRGIGLAIFGLGSTSLNEGNYPQAEEMYLQALSILRGVQADEEGWCLALLVYTMRRKRETAKAWQYAHQGLELALKAHVYHTAAMVILGIAALLVDKQEVELAIELHTLVMRYPLFKGSAWFREIAGHCVETAMGNLPPNVVQAAQERGHQRELFTTAEKLLEEISDRMEREISG